ncbi:biliverdin-producing heme oxygenase [Aeromicrobium halocynthiae]|uniref:Biliverdin-producing heme oxygenase n=1 Tax=Aeromicrobium halocynthiae TaxID=560557 RepID=A0ABP5HIQ6_9ACTN
MTIANDRAPSLAKLLKDGSAAEHTAAEGSSFIGELLAGRVNERGYADYLARLRRVYEALEQAGRALGGDPVVATVLDADLERLDAIDADLAHWGAGDANSPATDAYVARLQTCHDHPVRFVAHHYTRYLGDLSGGRAIGAIVRREFGLGDGPGAEFYRFEAIDKPKPYKDAYRRRLDALPLDAAGRQEALGEVKRAFALNGGLFAELSADLPRYRR